MKSHMISILIFLAGVINAAPIIGVLSRKKLEKAYGIVIQLSEIEILLRHRAILFGIIGGFMMLSAFYKPLQTSAIIMGFISMVSFIILAMSIGGFNRDIKSVIAFDIIGIGFLAIATALVLIKREF